MQVGDQVVADPRIFKGYTEVFVITGTSSNIYGRPLYEVQAVGESGRGMAFYRDEIRKV